MSGGWKHVGHSSYWAAFGKWAAQVGDDWAFDRDLSECPLEYDECICSRRGCIDKLYLRYKAKVSKDEQSSLDKMATGQPSPMGRYPSTNSQVCRATSSCSQSTAASLIEYHHYHFLPGIFISCGRPALFILFIVLVACACAANPDKNEQDSTWYLLAIVQVQIRTAYVHAYSCVRACLYMYLTPLSVQILGILANVAMEGRVLDSGGATGDAVATVMNALGFHVSTNDLNSRCVLVLCAIGQRVWT